MIRLLPGKDIFISYSSHDRAVAEALCGGLEDKGLRCWIAPRDITLGDWAEAIMEALNTCRVVVVVWSAHSEQSLSVMSEVQRALHNRLLIVPFRIEDFEPSRSFQFLFSTSQWFDASRPPLQNHFDRLARGLLEVLGRRRGREPRATRPPGWPDQATQPLRPGPGSDDDAPDDWFKKKGPQGLLDTFASWLDE